MTRAFLNKERFLLVLRINSTHTFLAGGYVVVREAEDPLTNRRKPGSGSPDIVSAGAVPRKGSQNPDNEEIDLRQLVSFESCCRCGQTDRL